MATKKQQEANANASANVPSVDETHEQERQVEEAAATERQPSAFYEVSVNPKLALTDAVSVGGFVVYADRERNRREGTWVLDDVQLEGVKNQRDPSTGLQYLVTKKISDDSNNEEG